EPPWQVDAPRIAAIRAEPAEVKPGATVSYSALVVSPLGTVEDPALDWSFCTDPKPLGENEIANADCLADKVAAIGTSTAAGIQATVPKEACRTFGSETQGTELRARDPDSSGGYYQPLRVLLDGR